MLRAEDRAAVRELAPVLRRATTLDARALVRLRLTTDAATVLVRLPFRVLVSRTVHAGRAGEPLDVAVRAADVLDWLDDDTAPLPQPRDLEWRAGLPPSAGWRRLETVPDDVVRGLVRQGALALQDAAAREGVPGAQPRSQVADALLDTTVLTVHSDESDERAEVSLRALSALTRMGFLRRGGQAHVDSAGRWIRVVGEYGTVYLERPGQRLLVR